MAATGSLNDGWVDEVDNETLPWGLVSVLEEDERKRRVDDQEESLARRVNALRIAERIETDALTIRARFVKPPKPLLSSAWHKGKKVVSAAIPASVSTAVYNAEAVAGTYIHSLQDTVVASATEKTLSLWKSAYATAYYGATAIGDNTQKIRSHLPLPTLPSLSTLLHTAHTIKDSVVGTIQYSMLEKIRALEKLEQQRRIEEDREGYARPNANRVARLILYANELSYPLVSPNKGFSKLSRQVEERERIRRLANKGEAEAHRLLAEKTSSLITSLGWPFISSAKGPKALSEFAILAEGERSRLLADQGAMFTARYNAHKVAGFVRSSLFPQNKDLGIKYVHKLEEKERKHRIKYNDYAVHQAHREAQLIADIGIPFCSTHGASGDETTIFNFPVRTLEVRKQAAENTKPQQLEHEDVGIYYTGLDIESVEEEERKSRISDKYLQQLAIANAADVSNLIKKRFPYKESRLARKAAVLHEYTAVPTISPNSLPVAVYQPLTRDHPLSVYTPPTDDSAAIYVPVILNENNSFLPIASIKRSVFSAPDMMQPLKKKGAQNIGHKISSYPDMKQPLKQRFAHNAPSKPLKTVVDTKLKIVAASPAAQQKLLQSAETLLARERELAKKEHDKVEALKKKGGLFATYRLQKHAALAEKHAVSAKIHEEWLRRAGLILDVPAAKPITPVDKPVVATARPPAY